MIGTTISDIKSVIAFLSILTVNILIYILRKPEKKLRWRHALRVHVLTDR